MLLALILSTGVLVLGAPVIPFYDNDQTTSPLSTTGNSIRPRGFDPTLCEDQTNYTECLKAYLKSIGVTREPIPYNSRPANRSMSRTSSSSSSSSNSTDPFVNLAEWPNNWNDTPDNAPTFWENDDPPSFFVDDADNVKFEFMICDTYYYPEEQHVRRGGDCHYFAGEVARWSALHFPTPLTLALIGTCGLEAHMMGLIKSDELDAMWWPPHAVLGKTKNGLCAYDMGFFWTNSMEMLKIFN